MGLTLLGQVTTIPEQLESGKGVAWEFPGQGSFVTEFLRTMHLPNGILPAVLLTEAVRFTDSPHMAMPGRPARRPEIDR